MKRKALATTFIVGLVVVVAIVLLLKPHEIYNYLKNMDPRYLLLAVVLQFASILVVSFRWSWLVHAAGYKPTNRSMILISIAGQAMNSITPASRWGGEPIKAYLLKKKQKVPMEAGMASLVVEKIMDIITFFLITMIAIVYGFYYSNVPPHIMILLGISLFFTFSLLFALFYVSFLKKVQAEQVIRLIDKFRWLTEKVPLFSQYKNKMHDVLNNYYSTVLRITNRDYIWYIGILFSLAYWSIEFARAYVIFKGLGFEVPIAVIATAYILSAMMGSIPSLPGGLGIVESTTIVIYSTSNIPSAVSGIVTIIDRLISYWLIILIGIPITWYLGVTSIKNGELNGNKDGSRQGPKNRKIRSD
ncbi:MAG: flippase-like domain-containing protein [Candidatus Diapherotrites archaeon]|nr:flippase-like domain-containing protein [Candidatus Diapherotrites archaeon]